MTSHHLLQYAFHRLRLCFWGDVLQEIPHKGSMTHTHMDTHSLTSFLGCFICPEHPGGTFCFFVFISSTIHIKVQAQRSGRELTGEHVLIFLYNLEERIPAITNHPFLFEIPWMTVFFIVFFCGRSPCSFRQSNITSRAATHYLPQPLPGSSPQTASILTSHLFLFSIVQTYSP